MKKLLYVCEADSGGVMEYAIRQSAAIAREGVEVHFLCKASFPVERLGDGIKVWEFDKSRESRVESQGLAGKLSTIMRLTLGQRGNAKRVAELATKLSQNSSTRESLPVTRHRPGSAGVSVLFACYKEYFAPFWVGPLRRLARRGVVMGTIAHDPVRDFVLGPLWWHQWSVGLGYSFVRHVFVHDDTPVDFGGKRPDGIEVHQIPHGPYEVAEPKIGRLEMRRRLGFLTTDDSDIHGCGTTKITKGHEKGEAGQRLDKPSGAAFSNPLTSELAQDVENTSLNRSASGPAGARIAPWGRGSDWGNQLADSKEFFEGQSQAGLQMGSDTSGDNSSSVSISVISGEKTSGAPEAPSPATSYSPLATSASPDIVFLAFGQIRDGKNLDLFLRAMTRLPENVKLLVAGKGDSGSSRPPEFYQELAEELGVAWRCRWDIRRIPDEEVGDMFAACDVVLVTYGAKFRSASGVLNAAVSAQKSVLASSGSGPLKTVVEKYQLGLFVEPDNFEEILTGVSKLVPSSSTGKCEFTIKSEWNKYKQENSWKHNAQTILRKI